MYFVGFVKGIKGYKFWDPIIKKAVISRDAVFDEQYLVIRWKQFQFKGSISEFRT